MRNRASTQGSVGCGVKAGFDVVCCHRYASRVCACGIERLDGEWLAAMCRDATCVSKGCLWNRLSSPVMMYEQ